MNKRVVNSDAEYVSFVFDKVSTCSVEQVENLLGVEFATNNGVFLSDLEIDSMTEEDDDLGTVDKSNWRKLKGGSYFPEQYPCVLVHWFGQEYDRFGKVSFELCTFVYKTDF